ncbi:MAG: hypothetical protein U0401_09395 [Anaerolineae bacterium]
MAFYLRYILWGAVAATIWASRRRSSRVSAWLPHLIINSLALLLPEIYGLIRRRFQLAERLSPERQPSAAALRLTFEQVAADNPYYVAYPAPVALGYILSHPKVNIYQGKLGRLHFLGFGLDAIPHSLTALALSTLVYDTIEALESRVRPGMLIYAPLRRLAAHKTWVAASVLALLTLIYETAEYLVHRSELKANPDESRVTIVWGVKDTIFDLLANGLGWALATWRQTSQARQPALPPPVPPRRLH